MLRATNLLHRPLVDVRVSAILYTEYEGQALHQTSLDFYSDRLGQQPYPFFIFPLTFFHPLDRQSPIYATLFDGKSTHFELVVFLSAVHEGTGESCQKRTSYLRQEILLDHRFIHPVLVLDGQGRYTVDSQHFDIVHSRDRTSKECVVQINGDGNERMEEEESKSYADYQWKTSEMSIYLNNIISYEKNNSVCVSSWLVEHFAH